MNLHVGPPPIEVLGRMAQIPRLSINSSVLVVQDGPGDDGRCGPEEAGAVLMLQATFATEEGAHHFWEAAGGLMEQLADAPGFIRRYSFPDGPTINLIALWRTVDDARAFAASPAHRSAVKSLYREGWQQTHFAAIWSLHTNHERIAFCGCGAATPVRERACRACGEELFDLHRAAPVG